MHVVGVVFESLDEKDNVNYGRCKVNVHLMFDVKIKFTRKSRQVIDVYKTMYSIRPTQEGALSRDSTTIAFEFTALNGIEVFADEMKDAVT